MIRALLTPLLGLLSPDILRTVEEARTNEARALGRAEHADETFAQAMRSHSSLVHDVATALAERDEARHEIETLRSEASSASDDSDEIADLRASLEGVRVELGRAEIRIGQLEREREELQRRCGDLSVKVVDGEALILALQSETHQAAARLTDMANACDVWREEARKYRVRLREAGTEPHAVEDVAPVAEPCAWCLGPAEHTLEHGPGGLPLHTCKEHYQGVSIFDVAARVAARVASCPARRTSPDPLAIACPTCEVVAGVGCVPSINSLRRTQEATG